jgi:hypothetical protein
MTRSAKRDWHIGLDCVQPLQKPKLVKRICQFRGLDMIGRLAGHLFWIAYNDTVILGFIEQTRFIGHVVRQLSKHASRNTSCKVVGGYRSRDYGACANHTAIAYAHAGPVNWN